MRKSGLITTTFLITCLAFFCNSDLKAQSSNASGTARIDMIEARKIIEENVKQFSEDFNNADSLAVAAHYARDGSFGEYVGSDLISIWGKMIRSARREGTPNLVFTTNSLFTDEEYLVELGTYQMKSANHEVKSEGKYLVVWKREDGKWKMYRDIGM